MTTTNHTIRFVRCTLALAAFAGSTLLAQAQTPQQPSPAAPTTLNLTIPAYNSAEEATFSSSSTQNDLTIADNHFDFVAAAKAASQPPGRRSGHPRYRGGNTNPDGSNKYAFVIGGGLTQPVGNTYHYLKPSYGIQVGGGRNFDKYFGVLLQFDYDHFGFNGRTLANQFYILNNPNVFAGSLPSLDGTSHVWSVTLNPTYNLYAGEGLGAYVVGGVGFYHKTANFFVTQSGTCYSPYYGYYACSADTSVDKYTSNAPGFNGGFGLTYKISRFSGQRLYAEARYVFVANQQRPGFTTANYNAITTTSTNLYPANSNRTTYIPVKVGIRF